MKKNKMDCRQSGRIAFEFLKEKAREKGFFLSRNGIKKEAKKYCDVLPLTTREPETRMRMFFWILYGQVIKDKFSEVEIIRISNLHRETLSEEEVEKIAYLVFLRKLSEKEIVLESFVQEMGRILPEPKYSSNYLYDFLASAINDAYVNACS
ncbi:MAG: hypothetical protein PHR47_02800 [Candidatus Pacebacteria bacterium]|nr:hypothetical protein [Candidatus Paceibacterota bacterium]